MENSEPYEAINAEIPLPNAVYSLSELFAQYGKSLFAVGGVVRDFLYHKFHQPNKKSSPKDVDLATEAKPEEITKILESPEGKKLGIKVVPKGAAFGVISAILNGEEYEIATFRTDWYDPESGDGRRPDQINFATPGEDAKRRDLYYNALFYDINKKEIRDYNVDSQGKGEGLKDIKNLMARPVGNPRDRFREDKLRIPRLIRFFSRFNPNEIKSHLDPDTLKATEEFKELIGVSPERISNEFLTGLSKALNSANYIKNYSLLGLNVFPGLKLNFNNLSRINSTKNPEPILAWLLRDNSPENVRSVLNKLKYNNDISDSVSYLLKLYNMDHNKIFNLLKQRDIYKQIPDSNLRDSVRKNSYEDIVDFAKIAGLDKELNHFLTYEPKAKSQDFLHLKGKAISDAMHGKEKEEYLRSLDNV